MANKRHEAEAGRFVSWAEGKLHWLTSVQRLLQTPFVTESYSKDYGG